jgi:hypothetical protein
VVSSTNIFISDLVIYILFALVRVNLNSLRDGTDNLTYHLEVILFCQALINWKGTHVNPEFVIRLGLTYESDLIIKSILIGDIKYAAYAISHDLIWGISITLFL